MAVFIIREVVLGGREGDESVKRHLKGGDVLQRLPSQVTIKTSQVSLMPNYNHILSQSLFLQQKHNFIQPVDHILIRFPLWVPIVEFIISPICFDLRIVLS